MSIHEVYQGSCYKFDLVFDVASLNNCRVDVIVKKGWNTEPIIEKSTSADPGGIEDISTETEVAVTVTINADDTINLSPQTLVWDAFLTDADGTPFRVNGGDFRILPSTRGAVS